MKEQQLARLVYRALIRLHPVGFRRRFADEMLWIFDVFSREGQTAFLLCDGARSAFLQHARLDGQEQTAAAFCLEVQTSELSLARIGQATVLGGALLFALSSAIGREMPPVSVFDQTPTCQHFLEVKPQPAMEIRQ